MKKVRYIGRASGGVTVEVEGVAVHVPLDEVVDLPDDIADSLLAQGDQWQGAGGKTAEPDDETPTTTPNPED